MTISVTDDENNTSSCTVQVNVVDDTSPTITTCAGNRTQSLDASCESTVPNLTGEVEATDNGTFTVTQSPTAGTIIGIGVTPVTLTVTDDADNSVTCTANITVTDDTLPVISGCPTDITESATDEYCGNNVTWTAPTATDNCSVTLTSSHNPGDFFDVGTTTVTYTATDPGGNTDICTFDVIVNQVTAPVISGDTDVCTPVTLNYSTTVLAGKTYLWSVTDGDIPGIATNDNVTIDWAGTTNGTVTLDVKSVSGCTISNTINVNKNATPSTGEIQSSSKLNRRL